MRIALVHYTKPPVVGGVERVIGDQARALRALGHEVEVVDREGWWRLSASWSAGFQPVIGQGASSPPTPSYFNPRGEITKSFHRLPHWEQEGALYFVTWRLADSLPMEVLEEWQSQKQAWLAGHPKPWTQEIEEEYHERFSRQMDEWLDQGGGECLLRNSKVSQVVADALRHFDGERYWLDAFVVMPNHVHVLVQPGVEWTLEKVVHSWKSFTGNQINKLLGRQGALWQDGYFDRIIRHEAHWQRCRQYVEENPRKAGLKEGEFVLGRGMLFGEKGMRAGSPRSVTRPGWPRPGSPRPWPRPDEKWRFEVILVHNVFTMPFDLEWTRELTALAAECPEVVWVNWIHDVAAVNPAYAPLGWNEPVPQALPVAVSEVRAREWAAVAGVPMEEVTVIPNGVDPGAVLGLTERIAVLAEERGLWEADLLLLLPARLVRRKNIEFGLDLLAALRAEQVNARLIVTGAPDPHQEDGWLYFEELKGHAERLMLSAEAVFAGEHGTLSDEDVRSLYVICDALFFPSRSEGFGLPLMEAVLHRLPVWCADIEAHREVAGKGARFFDPGGDPTLLARLFKDWLGAEPTLNARRRVWREHSWTRLCKVRLEPLLEAAIKRP